MKRSCSLRILRSASFHLATASWCRCWLNSLMPCSTCSEDGEMVIVDKMEPVEIRGDGGSRGQLSLMQDEVPIFVIISSWFAAAPMVDEADTCTESSLADREAIGQVFFVSVVCITLFA